jgi:hypothetical protein
VVLLGSTACGSSADDTNVRRVATAFFAATTAHQGGAACRALAPQAADGLASGDSTCAKEIDKLGLTGGRIRSVRVWGDRAQVVLTGDTVFLTRFPRGWLVTAAGCAPERRGPYDCDVEA